MALTVFPTILFNAGSGSDSAASGAGPTTAVTGTATSVNSTTITLTVSTGTFSQVAQDGSHVLWINGVGFVRISTIDTGLVTCVVETALTCTAANFAIGGKRATLHGTESLRLFAATATPTASGASGQWICELEDDQSPNVAITLSFTAGTGNLIIRGNSTSSRRTITQSGNAVIFTANTANKFEMQNLVFRHSNGTKSAVVTCSVNNTLGIFKNCIAGDSGGTNCPLNLWNQSGGQGFCELYDTSVLRVTGNGITGTVAVRVTGSEISRCGGIGINNGGAVLFIRKSIISWNTGDGAKCTLVTGINAYIDVEWCVFDNNTGDGLEISGNNQATARVVNNQFTTNGTAGSQYGFNVSGTQPHYGTYEYNNFFGNRTAAVNGITLSGTNTTLDPGYIDSSAGVRNYATGVSAQNVGFPPSTSTIAAGQSGTTTYEDIGVAQHNAGPIGRSTIVRPPNFF